MKTPNTLIILQARMSSSRLPNKVLKPILGKPMLAHQIARLAKVETPHQLIIATSEQHDDDAIANLCQQLGVSCFRGSLDDVLSRYYHAAQTFNTNNSVKHIVRLTGDCPLVDSDVVDNVINLYLSTGVDYCSNCDPATFPDGLDVEVFSLAALQKTYQLAKKPSEREHVTPFMRYHPEIFTLENYCHNTDLSYLRLTVDQAEDFELVSKIYQALYEKNNHFTLSDMLELIKNNPELPQINQGIIRNEGLLKSELADKEITHD